MQPKYVVAALAAALLLFSAPPIHAQTDPAHDPSILTGEQLAATGRPTVHAAIRELRPNWVRYRRSAERFPRVYVDSLPSRDTTVLHTLRPQDVRWVQYSSPAQARVRFDTANRGGVIHVSTRLPLSAAHPAPPAAPAMQTGMGLSLSGAALAPVISRGNRLSDLKGGGAALTGSIPAGPATLLLATVQYGALASGCECSDDTQMLSVEGGVKFQGAARAWAPFVTTLLGYHHLSWQGTGLREDGTERGLGASAGAGVDVRLTRGLLLTAEARGSMIGFGENGTGRLGSLRLGMTALLGR